MLDLRLENKALRQENNQLKKKLIELGLELEDKELQRKTLMEKIFKAAKSKQGGKPLGKKPGEPAYHRPCPKDKEVTEVREFKPVKCPYCGRADGLNKPQETIIKYFEDIIILPNKIVKKYIIHKCWCSHCKEYVRSNQVPTDIERLGLI